MIPLPRVNESIGALSFKVYSMFQLGALVWRLKKPLAASKAQPAIQ
jgi:hypothetical protein